MQSPDGFIVSAVSHKKGIIVQLWASSMLEAEKLKAQCLTKGLTDINIQSYVQDGDVWRTTILQPKDET